MIDKLKNLDRRWVFLFVLLAVIIPLMLPLNLKLNTTKPVEDIHAYIEKLPEGSVIMMSFDYGPSTKIELDPAAKAIAIHAFRRKHKIVTLALWPLGKSMADNVMKEVADDFNARLGEGTIKYGEDYVNLGYKPGGTVLLISLKDGFSQQFPYDGAGTPVSELPLMNKVKDYSNVDLVASFSAGVPGIREYIIIVSSQYGKKLAGACTAVTAPELYTFLNSGQLLGLMGGLKGAAEYEKLIDIKGDARKGMDAQSVVHLVIVVFIIISNVIYFTDEYRKRMSA